MSNVLIEALVTEMEPPMFKQMLGTADAATRSHGSRPRLLRQDNGHDRTTSVTAPAICRGILRYIPKLANAKIVRTWAGFEDVCIDGGRLGPVDEVPGLVVACAFTGHGFGISPIVGTLLAESALNPRRSTSPHSATTVCRPRLGRAINGPKIDFSERARSLPA